MKGSLKRGGNKNGLHAVKAAYSVLIEIVRILGEYRDNIVLIGGWAPQLLFQNEDDRHIGSIDVDLALDHRRITNEVYKEIQPGQAAVYFSPSKAAIRQFEAVKNG
jgi:hypothetical protein